VSLKKSDELEEGWWADAKDIVGITLCHHFITTFATFLLCVSYQVEQLQTGAARIDGIVFLVDVMAPMLIVCLFNFRTCKGVHYAREV
jgi:hypothetical protein